MFGDSCEHLSTTGVTLAARFFHRCQLLITFTYTHDATNHLISVSGQSSVSSYQHSGLGDRVSQTVNSVTTNYALDLNAGLTYV